ncbi:MAG: metallophosphoesterase family protein [Lachnospiraceae bacterium]|jgi:putative phosphoesterase|nr:metallophosphoesterase family protein [Lachnospiraceae bacterium]
MKILVISDIHSNIWALDKVLEVEAGWDRICCAGDLVDYGTAPKEVINTMRNIPNLWLVKGNHDVHTVNTWREYRHSHIKPWDYKWVHHNCERLDEEQIDYLDHLPEHLVFEADGWEYLLQHQYGPSYEVVESRYQFEEYWRKYGKQVSEGVGRRMIFGHSHRQCIHILEEDCLWLNPGSISYRRPDDPDKTAHYMVIEDGRIRIKQVPYNRSHLFWEAVSFQKIHGMMETELQDFYFFFGNARTSRDPLLEDASVISPEEGK